MRSTSLPAANIVVAETTRNTAIAMLRSLRDQPNSSTIGLSIRLTAKRPPPLVKRTRKQAASNSAPLDDFRDFDTVDPAE